MTAFADDAVTAGRFFMTADRGDTTDRGDTAYRGDTVRSADSLAMSVREATPSFFKMCETWVDTVRLDSRG